jgi:rod shape-determining protein MreC
MVASRSYSTNPARIPALGIRLLVLLFLSVILMVVDHRENHLNNLRQTIGAGVYPLRVMVDAPFRLWEWVGDARLSRNELHLENNRLKAERLITRARLQRLISLEAENDRLREILDARELVRDDVRVVEILSVDANPYRHNIVISAGELDGVYDGQAIVDADGFVGQVIRTGRNSAQAILISDPDHALPVEVNRNGLRTIAVGIGKSDVLDLPFLPNNADIQVGDLLVTSGLGGAFPPGYPVAVIASIDRIPQEEFAAVSATPTAALDQVREIMLIFSARPTAESTDDTDTPDE